MHTNTFCKYRKKLLASPRVHLFSICYCESDCTGIKFFQVSSTTIKENVIKLQDRYKAAQTVNTSLQASPPTEGIIAKSISLSRVQIEDNTLHIGSFVACTYDEKCWLGMVAQISDEFRDHNINFMHPSEPEKQFHWLAKVNTCWSSNILCVIEASVLSSSSSRKYIISENDYKKNY